MRFFGLTLLGCGNQPREPVAAPTTPPTEAGIRQAALAAVAAVPWDTTPAELGYRCNAQAACDTLIVEPRIVTLPAQAPAFFVPDRRDLAATLNESALSLTRLSGRNLVLGSWRECSARRDSRAWAKSRAACVALAVAGLENSRADAMTFALLVLTPAKGLAWPRVRATRPRDVWHGRVVSNTGK
jgi:hypothetical protein